MGVDLLQKLLQQLGFGKTRVDGEVIPTEIVHACVISVDAIVSMLGDSLCRHADRYSLQELTTISQYLCAIAIDRSARDPSVEKSVEMTLCTVLRSVPESEWLGFMERTVDECFHLTKHHRIHCQLCSIWPATKRGRQLQRHMIIVALKDVLKQSPPPAKLDYKVIHLSLTLFLYDCCRNVIILVLHFPRSTTSSHY